MMSRSMGRYALGAAVAVVIVAAVRMALVRPPADLGPGPDDAAGSNAPWEKTRVSSTIPEHSDPFRWTGPVVGLVADEFFEPIDDLNPQFFVDPVPRIVGLGWRSDGLAFVGCAADGWNARIVRVGEMCGAFTILAVEADSVRLQTPLEDSILTVAVGS